MKQIKEEDEFYSAIAAKKPTVALFKTTWCPDCHYIDPFMPEVMKKYEDRLSFIQLDRDDFPELCTQLNILGIPSFIVFAEGKELTRFVSKLRKTREEIEGFLEKSAVVAETLAGMKE
ncbi:thioredoxin family protein [Gorillibacterium massiliense]|uniref:thioredoxin family protein n=1 Tax=Gorillibacterium massiliense TaxID=1280390 RepID=UPI000594EDE0|nr:thioredoxin family protein [Gorillibacterium massiliense]